MWGEAQKIVVSMCTPTVDCFAEELVKEPRWYDFGIFLGVPSHELESIKNVYSTNGTTRCLMEMHKWLERTKILFTWGDVAKALSRMDNFQLARHISQKYSSEEDKADKNVSKRKEDDHDHSRQHPILSRPLMNEFENILASFAMLVLHVKNAFACEKISLEDLQFFLQIMYSITFLSNDEVNSLEKIFINLQPHYSFLSYNVICILIDNFLVKKHVLQERITNYETQLQKFKTSSKMKDLIEAAADNQSSDVQEIKIKFREFWSNIVVEKFERLAKCVFEELYNQAVLIRVESGCICVTWSINKQYSSKLAQKLRRSIGFLRELDILSYSTLYETTNITHDIGCTSLVSAVVQAIQLQKIKVLEMFLALSDLTSMSSLLLSTEKSSICQIKDSDNFYCLSYASFYGHTDVVKFLLDNGSQPSVQAKSGMTPLMAASAEGHIEIVDILLRAQADVNMTRDDGITALYFSSFNGYSHIVKMLLNSKAVPELHAVNNNITPLIAASDRGHQEVVDLLLEANAIVDKQTIDGRTAVYQASIHGYTLIVKSLLKANANPNIAKQKGITPLMATCWQGHTETAQTLLSASADPHANTKSGHTALYYATIRGNFHIVSILLDYNVDINITYNDLLRFPGNLGDGLTCLMIGSFYGHCGIVEELLLLKNINVNQTSSTGITALHLASMNGHLKVVELLTMNTISEINAVDSLGETPRSYASMYGHKRIVELIDEIQVTKFERVTKLSQSSLETYDSMQTSDLEPSQEDIDNFSINSSIANDNTMSESFDSMSVYSGFSDD